MFERLAPFAVRELGIYPIQQNDLIVRRGVCKNIEFAHRRLGEYFFEPPHFRLPNTREEWLQSLSEKRDGQDGGMRERARSIANIVKGLHTKKIFSIGAGNGGLEYFIAQEGLDMTATEYSPRSVARVFTKCVPRLRGIGANPLKRLVFLSECIIMPDGEWNRKTIYLFQCRNEWIFHTSLRAIFSCIRFCLRILVTVAYQGKN